ncbi:TIGR03620 family F420-dependent LLM class oxidoreductase [Kineosporia sp. J2-2]|uniref:TIGR03620 family F420-dependent LLM class oxidoreductase n=1 Tax=Kineosporia corallincola TaxID=2835133 RepID=A0ABS5T9M6_9ACTN|nr:TIGR03620 family F420-dependent LLM class oxidoreductase [Kineosporia corallincola]MBT0767761.1 TIGR03620 family F420-dependent LLM class oxidoreductase [Kineosporia corallincola]
MFDTDRTHVQGIPLGADAPYGVWLGLGPQALGAYSGREGELAAELEGLNFPSLWLGGSWGADLAPIERLLAGSERLVVGTSIANIWRDPAEQVAAAHTRVAERFGNRFVLGLGVGHHPQTELNQGQYARPLAKLAAYLDVLDAADPPVPAGHRALAALGPKALELARDRSAGSLPYLTTPEHTRTARETLGPERFLAPEQKVVLSDDPDEARGLARTALHHYLELPNYLNSWRRLGFGEPDFENGGSDRLIDALFGWGPDALDHVRRHREAGADHVCVQPIPRNGRHALDELRIIARELL